MSLVVATRLSLFVALAGAMVGVLVGGGLLRAAMIILGLAMIGHGTTLAFKPASEDLSALPISAGTIRLFGIAVAALGVFFIVGALAPSGAKPGLF